MGRQGDGADPEGGIAGAGAGDDCILSYRFILGPLMDYILELEDRQSGAEGGGAAAGVGGEALVGECAAWAAGSVAEVDAAVEGESADCGGEYSLVSVRGY